MPELLSEVRDIFWSQSVEELHKAAETAVALAIIINVYRNYHSDQVNSIENMKF